jgi:hypothetical protein
MPTAELKHFTMCVFIHSLRYAFRDKMLSSQMVSELLHVRCLQELEHGSILQGAGNRLQMWSLHDALGSLIEVTPPRVIIARRVGADKPPERSQLTMCSYRVYRQSSLKDPSRPLPDQLC